DLNPEVRTVEHCTRFSAVNAAGILENYGIAVDCTDNLGTRSDLNPEVRTVEHCTRFSAVNAAGILENYGIAVDCTDNLGTRYDLNEACWRKGIPWVYGAVSEYHGQVSTFIPGRTACFRCLYPVAQEETARHPRGVLNALVGTVGGIQAGEVLKLIIGLGKPLAGRLLVWEALPAAFTSFMLDRDPACPICGT
ncbi:HesA/MoeB/ThiF family protein, partial [Desulforudis sp. 1190]|uniref:HesA/MoeB/ThiF family protein n=1 Tax=Desulforudis sp. 1190 TaxID=3416136 RepID=UPI003CF439CA